MSQIISVIPSTIALSDDNMKGAWLNKTVSLERILTNQVKSISLMFEKKWMGGSRQI